MISAADITTPANAWANRINTSTATESTSIPSNLSIKQKQLKKQPQLTANQIDKDGFVKVLNNKQAKRAQASSINASLKKKTFKKEKIIQPQIQSTITPSTTLDTISDDDMTIKNDEDEPNIIRPVSVDYSVKSEVYRPQRASLPSTPLTVRTLITCV